MMSIMHSRRPTFPALRRVAALVCVVAYLAGGTEALPQALALGAWLEGSHTVRVARDGEHFTVVLSHERGRLDRPDYTPRHQPGCTLHRHGAAARMLCVFVAQPSRQADHVACFATGSLCENLTRVIDAKAAPKEMASADWATLVSADVADTRSPLLTRPDSCRPRPPDSLRPLRSTVLVL